MPLYDYRCANGHTFEARHGFNDPAPACPECGEAHVQRVITSAPGVMQGINASAGKKPIPDCRRITKSPSSCGISCAMTLIATVMPSAGLCRNAAAIRTPSTKLWTPSPSKIMIAEGA